MTSLSAWVRTTALAAAGSVLLATPALADPSIWHLSDEDSDIYVFGTVHILRPDVVWRTEDVMAAFEASETVYFEAPVNDPAEAAAMVPLVQRYGFNPAGETLTSRISDNGAALLERIAPRVGLTTAMLEPLRPWLASVTITLQYISAQGYDPQSGVEATLWPMANEAGKTLAYFETIEEQLGFFGGLPEEVENVMLEQTLERIEEAPGMLDGLVTAWAEGDQAMIDELMNGDFRDESPEVHDIIIVQRNARWVDDIEELLAGSGTVFIAVGAGHLPGDEGVIAMLRARGHTVEGP
ncbi:TraB/GumN family protein [Hyphobacterium marinum]|uniref:TraB/GumN family protein n=1 Tax=Hyphobacterium marinum TaxID=3116574 RepID=A0ABU7LVA1_9PROT|nr:TraB/GumN family protein [Hyphobacterium sp. Y6023]MEE2565491.1 TraB/GumN family protein [Hyphobacterium sp. Y6023]